MNFRPSTFSSRCLVSLLALVALAAAPAQATWVVPSIGSHHSRTVCLDLFDEDSGAFAGEIRCEFSFPSGATVFDDGSVFAGRGSSGNTTLSVYDAFSGSSNFLFSNGSIGEVAGMVESTGGDLLASSRDDHNVYRLDPATGAVLDTPIFGGGLAGPTAIAEAPGGDIFVADEAHGRLFRIDGTTGDRIQSFAWSISVPRAMTFGADGLLYVSSLIDDAVLQVDPSDGSTLGVFAAGGGLDAPEGLVFGVDGNLYVSSSATHQILQFDGTTGAFLSVFATDPDLVNPSGLAFAPNGDLYAANLGNAKILRFDDSTGASLGVAAEWVSGVHRALVFKPNGDILASGDTGTTRQVRRMDGTTGIGEGFFAATGADGVMLHSSGDLLAAQTGQVRRYDISTAAGISNLGTFSGPPQPSVPGGLHYGPDGALYVAATGSDQIWRFDATSYEGSLFAEGGGLTGLGNFRFGPDGDLYASSRDTHEVYAYDGTTGAALGVFASGGGLNLPFDLEFGADGDLYVDSAGNGILRYDGATGAFIDTFIDPATDFEAAFLDRTTVTDSVPGETPVIDETGDGVDPLIDPTDAAIGPDGTIYVVGRVSQNVFAIDSGGVVTQLLDSSGGASGVPLSNPFRIAVGADGTVAVASDNEVIHRIKPGGAAEVILDATQFAWSGAVDVVVGPDGSVYATGPSPSVWRVSPSNVKTRLITNQGDGLGNMLGNPSSLWIDSDGFLYLGARGTNNVFEISPSGTVTEVFDGDSVSPAIYGVTDIAKDGLGNLFVGGDAGDPWSRVFKVEAGGGSSFLFSTSIPLLALTADSDGDLYYGITRGIFYHRTPTGVITPLDDLMGPVSRAFGGILDFEVDPSGDLVMPSLLGNSVYHLATPRECEDGIDNDGDGLVDFPDDPGCRAADWIEDPVCDDDIDNDGDGLIDFDGGPLGEPADPVCKSAWEAFERRNACGLGFEAIAVLLPLMLLRGRRARESRPTA